MSRLAGWIRGTPRTSSNPSPTGSQVDLRAAELANLQDAMISASKIMNDDIDGAEEDLKRGNSAFHLLGRGMTTFMRSILGFEKEIMAAASAQLAECETASWNEQKKAQKEATSSANGESRIYPPGSEYALVQAEAQLMGAMVAVLHESLTEAIKGFMKLRKAFVTLNGLMESEAAFLKQRGLQLHNNKDDLPPMPERQSVAQEGQERAEDSDLEFVEAPEELSGSQTPAQYQGHLSKDTEDADKKLAALSIETKDGEKKPLEGNGTPLPSISRDQAAQGPEADIFTNPIDVFIHSGTNMCLGILLLLISMIPPAFSRLLSIVGFTGDRERGVKMLWQSTRFDNINGAAAGLVLLAYHNGLLGFSDILPSEEDATETGAIVGYPKQRCAELLHNMRTRYPESRLWRFEEARGLSNSRDLPGAIVLLAKNTDSKMRQVTALNSFELSLDTMYVGDYPQMRDSFLRCVELNDWSHALYYFLAGCAEIELYRTAFHAERRDETQIKLHKKKAEEYMRKAPSVAGKKRFMSRPLPFEQFVQRKVQKWDERSKDLKVDFIDAVGVSPVQEMVYLWNGGKKMQPVELERAAQGLSWGRLTAPEEIAASIKADKDEHAVADLCLAGIYRQLGRLDEARTLCESIISIDRLAFKGPTKDDYAQPAATYEMAALAWVEAQRPELRMQPRPDTARSVKTDTTVSPEDEKRAIDAWRRKKTDECQSWLEKVAKWEAFVLDARIGMRVQTGTNTLRWFKRENGWETA
ncbi:breast cancer protein [Xylariales sp. AK1849]|nr:breast cancer protein [Xylariales sp. AK1849]